MPIDEIQVGSGTLGGGNFEDRFEFAKGVCVGPSLAVRERAGPVGSVERVDGFLKIGFRLGGFDGGEVIGEGLANEGFGVLSAGGEREDGDCEEAHSGFDTAGWCRVPG